MKNNLKWIKVFFIFSLCALLLGSCGIKNKLYSMTLVGSWYGDGTFDILGVDTPFEFATKLEFNENGTLEATVNDESTTYQYSATDDTITIQHGDMSWGVNYIVNGTSLNLKTGSDFSTFTKQIKDID